MADADPRFGYKVVYLSFWRMDDSGCLWPDPPTVALNALYDKGWRLVEVVLYSGDAPHAVRACIFARPYAG